MTDPTTTNRTAKHLEIRKTSGGALSAVMTFEDGYQVDLAKFALSDGFVITGLDDNFETREITLSCKLVVSELDLDVDVLRAQLVDANGDDVTLEALAERLAASGGAQ